MELRPLGDLRVLAESEPWLGSVRVPDGIPNAQELIDDDGIVPPAGWQTRISYDDPPLPEYDEPPQERVVAETDHCAPYGYCERRYRWQNKHGVLLRFRAECIRDGLRARIYGDSTEAPFHNYYAVEVFVVRPQSDWQVHDFSRTTCYVVLHTGNRSALPNSRESFDTAIDHAVRLLLAGELPARIVTEEGMELLREYDSWATEHDVFYERSVIDVDCPDPDATTRRAKRAHDILDETQKASDPVISQDRARRRSRYNELARQMGYSGRSGRFFVTIASSFCETKSAAACN